MWLVKHKLILDKQYCVCYAAVDMEPSTHKYERVKSYLMSVIENSDERDRARLPSHQELCEMFSVSHITVRKAISDLAAAGYVESEQGRGVFGVRTGDMRARNQPTHIVGCSFTNVASVSHPYVRLILSGIDSVLNPCGYGLALYPYPSRQGGVSAGDDFERAVARPSCDGLILLSPMLPAQICVLGRHRFPYVMVNNSIAAAGTGGACVATDIYEAARLFAEHIADKGYKRIFMVCGDRHSYQTSTLVKALNLLADVLHFNRIEEQNIYPCGWPLSTGSGERLLAELTPLKPDLVIFGDCFAARGFYMSAIEKGIRFPDDTAIMTFTDLPFEDAWESPFTALDTKLEQLGREAAKLLLRRIDVGEADGTTEVAVKPSLIVRRTG